MSNRAMLDKIKHVIVTNMASNEQMIGEVYAYNDVVQCNTYLVLTPHRIFYWHEQGGESKLRTKSYNLIQTVFVSRGVFSIHFNDEIIKLLISNQDEEYRVLSNILSERVEIVDLSREVAKTTSNEPQNDDKRPRYKAKPIKKKAMEKDWLKLLLVVISVILVSFLATLGWIKTEEWMNAQHNSDALTEERRQEILRDIDRATQRQFMISQGEQLLVFLSERISLIGQDIDRISPSDRLFNWNAIKNDLGNHKIEVKKYETFVFVDEGPYFDIAKDMLTINFNQIFVSMNAMLDLASKGVDTQFKDLNELIVVKQRVLSIQESIAEMKSLLASEQVKMSEFISEQNNLIQRK